MEFVKKHCPICGQEFEIYANDRRIKRGKNIYCSKACADEGAKTGRIKDCPICGKSFYTTRRKTCSVECGRQLKKQNWKHKIYFENGYLVEYCNGYNKKGNVKQHRKIVENFLGRRLGPDEIVHHINGDKTDNRIENLEVMSRGEHSSLHRKAEKATGKHLFGGYHNN